jgi:glycosyltransferase involved in cell wall biosynthesis
MLFTEEDISPQEREAARNRLGLPPDQFLVATFGYVSPSKGITPLIVALELLRSWNIRAELFLVGSDSHARGYATTIAEQFDVRDAVHTSTEYIGADKYRDYMLAVDAAVQLRTYDFGQLSAALADCISAGLPTVTVESLGESCGAPRYVSRIDNHISPLLIAEALAVIHEQRRRDSHLIRECRRAYLDEHNFDVYARRLTAALGFG